MKEKVQANGNCVFAGLGENAADPATQQDNLACRFRVALLRDGFGDGLPLSAKHRLFKGYL